MLVAEITTSMLAEEGHSVQHARTSDEAMQILAHRKFNLILCDIDLPGMIDGLSLAKSLRLINPTTRILLMTGYSQMAVDAALDFIVLHKPFKLGDLSKIVSYTLREDISQSNRSELH